MPWPMRKEVMIAILIGFGIGLIITFGVITARSAINQNQEKIIGSVTPTAEVITNQEKSIHKITLSQPENKSVVNSEKIEVSGTTTPLSAVAVMIGSGGDAVTAADEAGRFYQEVTLIGGANIIKAVSVSPKGEKAESRVSVVYSTAEF